MAEEAWLVAHSLAMAEAQPPELPQGHCFQSVIFEKYLRSSMSGYGNM